MPAKISELVEKNPGMIAFFSEKYLAKDFHGRVIPLGMRDDVVRWEPAEVLLTRLPPAFAARMDSTRLAMQAGRFPMPALTP